MKKENVIRLRIDSEVKNSFVQYCKQKGITASQYIRDAIDKELLQEIKPSNGRK